jgi:hypothetical protein
MKKKSIKLRMVEFAREIGALRSDGNPDWYMVAEDLAATYRPELISGPRSGKPVGKPPRDWFGLCLDIDAVRRRWPGCSVDEACQKLADGEHPHRVPVTALDGSQVTMRVVLGRWKGQDWAGLKSRYYQFLRNARENHQRTLSEAWEGVDFDALREEFRELK